MIVFGEGGREIECVVLEKENEEFESDLNSGEDMDGC